MAEILSKATRALARKAPVAAFAADEEYLRVDDFARRMNVKTKTARNWISLGRVKTIRFSAKAIRVLCLNAVALLKRELDRRVRRTAHEPQKSNSGDPGGSPPPR
jgi:hypothetical protein